MTDKQTPTDAEILDAAEDFRSQYTHGGTTFDEFDEIGFARAVLAKWGQPAQARTDTVLYDPKAVLDVFNGARAGSEKPVGYMRGILAVIAHWESRPEPHRWMVPAPAGAALIDPQRPSPAWRATVLDAMIQLDHRSAARAMGQESKEASMALSDRDCRHGRQIGKCADCALDHMEMAADAEARRVDELTALRKQDTELIRQLVDALECNGEPDDPGHRCSHCDDYVDRNSVLRKVARARLGGTP